MLLAGEGITSGMQRERQMPIDVGSYANYVYDQRTVELAVVDRSAPDQNQHIVIPASMLAHKGTIKDTRLPFEITIDDYFPNSDIAPANDASVQPRATTGSGMNVPVFGRAPIAFPNLFLPTWQIEGLATYAESAITGEGRLHAGEFRAITEEAARQLKIDPAELRRKNFIREFPHQTPVIMNYDAGDYEASLNEALKVADYKGFPARRAEARSRGKLRGIGFSTYIEACGLAPSAAVGSLGAGVGLWESAEVRVTPTGGRELTFLQQMLSGGSAANAAKSLLGGGAGGTPQNPSSLR